MKHLLVFRFSSLGDVAMTVPVIKNLLQQYPQLQVTMVSAAFHAPLFAGIERLHFIAADLSGKHKGFIGLFKLFNELRRLRRFDAVADLHNVLRTQILKIFFVAAGYKWISVDKGRAEKKALTRAENKALKPLPSTFQRYADVFSALGFDVQLDIDCGIKEKGTTPIILQGIKAEGIKCIGIAPFAQFERKVYPAEGLKKVLRLLLQHRNVQLFLLGGKEDVAVLRQWTTEIPQLNIIVGTMSFSEELNFIAHLDAVVSMDSANMHLASLFGVPVVSIWGATHPYAGFYGWGQDAANAMQIELYCRPCSVFGNKPGPRPDLACMHGISPIAIYQRIAEVVHL